MSSHMNEKDEKPSSFKVVDKRRFNDSGEAILGQDNPRDDLPKEIPSLSQDEKRPVLDFSLFTQSLAHQAMMGLGVVPWPDSGLIKTEIVLAKEMIDILKILQEKTKGNLDNNEQALLDSLVYQLQVTYVEAIKGNNL